MALGGEEIDGGDRAGGAEADAGLNPQARTRWEVPEPIAAGAAVGYVSHVAGNLRIWAERLAGLATADPGPVAPYERTLGDAPAHTGIGVHGAVVAQPGGRRLDLRSRTGDTERCGRGPPRTRASGDRRRCSVERARRLPPPLGHPTDPRGRRQMRRGPGIRLGTRSSRLAVHRSNRGLWRKRSDSQGFVCCPQQPPASLIPGEGFSACREHSAFDPPWRSPFRAIGSRPHPRSTRHIAATESAVDGG